MPLDTVPPDRAADPDDSPEPATVRLACRQCGKVGPAVRSIHPTCGYAAVRIADLPDSWILFEPGPPGDDGLGFACRELCLYRWMAENRGVEFDESKWIP